MTYLGTTEQGCLLFADITGYTRYIGETEITHAQDVIADLIETMVGVITPTFRISRVEGDAVFAFAPSGSVSAGVVLDTVDSTYFAFRERLRDIGHATSCPCQACIRIPSLDLKFFLHEGEYAVRTVAGFTELSGLAPIVLHRLAKGTANTVAGGHAYAVYTAPIVAAMGLDPATEDLVSHQEEFADTGPIEVFVQDLEARWTRAQEVAAVVVGSEEAVHVASFESPAPAQVVWEHLVDPVKRLAWQTHVTAVLPQAEGRQKAGMTNHCMHGPDVTVEHIAAWRPFAHITMRYDTMGVTDWYWSYRVDTIEGGTRMTLLISDPGAAVWGEIGPTVVETVNMVVAKLEAVVGEEWAGR